MWTVIGIAMFLMICGLGYLLILLHCSDDGINGMIGFGFAIIAMFALWIGIDENSPICIATMPLLVMSVLHLRACDLGKSVVDTIQWLFL